MGQKPFPEPAKCILMGLTCSWQQDALACVGQGGRVLLQRVACPCLVMSPRSHHLQFLLTPCHCILLCLERGRPGALRAGGDSKKGGKGEEKG